MASILDLADDSSDSENDFDYIPSEDEASELSLDDNTDEEGLADTEPASKRKKRKKGKKDLKASSEDSVSQKVEDDKEKNCVSEQDEKKRAESLWEDFLKDVKPPVPKKLPIRESKNIEVSTTSLSEKTDQAPKKVTVSEVFEFAGEAVVVTKEVDQNSEEAKSGSKSATMSSNEKQSPKEEAKDSQNRAIKRPSGLGSVLGTIMNKKQKLSTLQKSMLDWRSFKKDEGIEEELDQHRRSKDSYVEKQAFLQRADVRQFEIEKDIRHSSRSNR